MIAGIDYSTRYVDVVLLDEDTDAAEWHRFALEGKDAFDRARSVDRIDWLTRGEWLWENVMAIGIEDPRGYNAGSMYRIQGALLASLPWDVLVHPLVPSEWRKTVGLPGNASKLDVMRFVQRRPAWRIDFANGHDWPQDACDAYCIALATRNLIQVTA